MPLRYTIAILLNLLAYVCSVGQSLRELQTAIRISKTDTAKVNSILALSEYYLQLPGEDNVHLDSAVLLAVMANQLSQSLNYEKGIERSIFDEGIVYIEAREFDKLLQLLKRTSVVNAYRLQSASIEYRCFTVPIVSGDLQAADSIAGKLIKSFQELPYSHQQKILPFLNTSITSLGYYYLFKGDLSHALNLSLKMIWMMEQIGDMIADEQSYELAGRIYLELGKPEQSIEYFKVMESIVYRRGRVLSAGMFKNISRAFIALNKAKEGLTFLENAVKQGVYKDERSIVTILESIGNCYFAMKKFDMAERYYLKGIERAKNLLHEESHNVHFPLSKLYIKTKKYDLARPYLNELIIPFNDLPLYVRRDAHFMLYQVDSAKGNLASALHHYKTYKSLNDSIFNEKQSSTMEILKMDYETEKKDRDIQLLTKKSELQQADLRQTNILKNTFIAGAVVLLIVLSLGYSKYKLKQENNLLLQLNQEEINQSNKNLQKVNGQLQKLVMEKEWLVKEIHHRVKNNLQIVVSLLNTQASYLREGDALSAIRESQLRMQVISLLHQRLYNIENSRLVDMRKYITELVGYITESYRGFSRAQVAFNLDPIHLDISQAISVGLILNEAITNAIKYAFNVNQHGCINVSLIKGEGKDVLLRIADNGNGLPANFFAAKRNSLGMRLMETLSEQVDGSLKVEDHHGVIVSVQFAEMVENYSEVGNEI